MSLSPSDRVKLIAEVARRLGAESWALIDLTLKQFGQSTSDAWGGSEHDYVIEMLGSASDEALLGLAHHVGYQVDNPSIGIDPPFWRDGELRLFLSHLADERQYAGDLKDSLVPYGITPFVAHADIHPTAEWEDEIVTALSTAEVLIALLHSGFNKSRWTDQEVGFAIGRGLPVFSVRLGQDPYGFFGRYQAFNGNEKSPEVLANEIFDALRAHKSTQRRMSGILVKKFENSYNFDNAKKLMSFLEDLQYWGSGYSKRITDAIDDNSQVKNAFGVPRRVAALVSKWEAKDVS